MFIKVFNNCRFVCMVTLEKDSKVFDPVPQSPTQAYSSLGNTHKPPCVCPNRDTLWISLINHFPWPRKQNSLSVCLPNRLFPMLRRSSSPKCHYWAHWKKSADKHLLLPGYNSSWSLAREMQHFSVKARLRPGRVTKQARSWHKPNKKTRFLNKAKGMSDWKESIRPPLPSHSSRTCMLVLSWFDNFHSKTTKFHLEFASIY